MSTNRSADAPPDRAAALTADLADLVRDELRRAQSEMTAKASQVGKGGALLAGAAVFGALAAGSAAAWWLRLLDRFLPPRAAAAVATLCYAGGAAALAAVGAKEVRRALPLIPDETVSSVREGVEESRRRA
jgi:Putative Actinobacterial Holin-X, holin superfamily III